MKKVIGDRIRLFRQSKNRSQENMAFDLNISIGAYSNIERGKTNITVTRLAQIAEILDVNITDFFREPFTGLISDEGPTRLTSPQFLTEEIEQLKKEINYLKEINLLLKSSNK